MRAARLRPECGRPSPHQPFVSVVCQPPGVPEEVPRLSVCSIWKYPSQSHLGTVHVTRSRCSDRGCPHPEHLAAASLGRFFIPHLRMAVVVPNSDRGHSLPSVCSSRWVGYVNVSDRSLAGQGWQLAANWHGYQRQVRVEPGKARPHQSHEPGHAKLNLLYSQASSL